MNWVSTLLNRFAPLLPPELRVKVKRMLPTQSSVNSDYESRMRQETDRFAGEIDVNALPQIFHYWSHHHVRPMQEALGFSNPDEFFAKSIARHAAETGRAPIIVSIGSGNCDTEVRVATALRALGLAEFTIECLDLTGAMLERGRELAKAAGLGAHFRFTLADFNKWRPKGRYDVVMANQSLHHVVELEHLFSAIADAIGDAGIFVTSDMIGRNGHQRWPEALEILQEFWSELPETHRYNQQLRRQETQFLNWDCSVEGFEGVRAQDILPLLIERFGFKFFFAFGNLVTPFVDRGFGHHFDGDGAWDKDFIDRLHARDQQEIEAGRIKPTHMLAVMSNDRSSRAIVHKHLTPEFCVRNIRE